MINSFLKYKGKRNKFIFTDIHLLINSSTNPLRLRLDSNSSLDIKENSPIRSIHRRKLMDYQQYNTFGNMPSYPSYTSTSGFNQYNNNNNNRDQRYLDSYGRSTANPLPAMFRTAAAASNSPGTSSRGQQFSYRPNSSASIYDTPRNYGGNTSSGYLSDTNDVRRSSISIRPIGTNNSATRRVTNPSPNAYQPPPPQQQSYYSPSPVTYNTKISTGNDQNYFSDSEYVGAGPRYTKISRQANPVRRPSNVVLPIRSVSSKAYDNYVEPEPPKPPQPLFDVYRYQQEQRERERQLQQQQQAAAAARFKPPQLNFPPEQRRKSDRKFSCPSLFVFPPE